MLIPSQLTLIKRCQQQGGKSYQLSKITNDSARGERGNVMLDVSECGRESRHDWQPWPLVPPPCMRSHCDHYHGYHSHHAHCTQSVCHVSYSLCLPSASPTVPATPAVPSVVSTHTLPSVLITTKPPTITILAVSPYLLYPPYPPCLVHLPYPSVYSAYLSG